MIRVRRVGGTRGIIAVGTGETVVATGAGTIAVRVTSAAVGGIIRVINAGNHATSRAANNVSNRAMSRAADGIRI